MTALLQILGTGRQRVARIALCIVVLAAFLTAVAVDFTRNLVMLAYLRGWTNEKSAGLVRLAPVARWLISNERADSLLQAQASALAATLGDDAAAAESLEKARSAAPIAEHCDSSAAMQIEHLARPLLPAPSQEKIAAFVAHTASENVVSQMRSVAADDGGSDCMHVLTAAIPADTSAFAAISALLPVRPGHRYHIRVECFVTGSLQVAADDGVISMRIAERDAWTTTNLETAPQSSYIAQIRVVAHSGAGRVACHDVAAYDLTAER